MGGILVFGVIFGYYFLSRFIVEQVYKTTQNKIAKYIAIAILVLIPTWDIIIGYPIYKYLCMTKAGVHIYKSVDDVEGFYIGEKSKDYEPYKPYKGYKYIDYKEKESGKYYRSYWIDDNTSKDCMPYIGARDYDYTQAFRSGKCIVKKEISEGEVSRWEYDDSKYSYDCIVPIVNIDKSIQVIRDRKTDKNIAEGVILYLDNNWFTGYVRSKTSTRGNWSSCGQIRGMLVETLKPKQGEK